MAKNKQIDNVIEISVWIIAAILLVKYVPKNKLREASVSFLFKQVMTWLFGLIVVELKLIKYPTRLFFKKTIKSSFTFEYFVYPALCALFNLYYPEKRSGLHKFVYYLGHTSFITIIERVLEKYTNLIMYKKWSWYWTFATIWLTYYFSRLHYRWFYKKYYLEES